MTVRKKVQREHVVSPLHLLSLFAVSEVVVPGRPAG